MARLTFAQIVTQGGLLGGNDAVSTWIGTKLKAWLRKHYAAWPWPFLITQATGLSLPAGTTELTVGAGSGGLTPQVSRLFSPIMVRTSDFRTRTKAPIRQVVGGPPEMAFGNVDTATQTGAPMHCVVLPSQTAAGLLQQIIQPYPIPEQAYVIGFTYQKMPDDPASTDVPIYPNEMTLIQAAKCAAIEYDRSADPFYTEQLTELASMVTADRDAYGGSASFGDMMQLDDDVFPTTSTDYTNKLPFV
jgi:hypothetical protein